jgi:putative FmdB family regulatory protein
MPTYDYRCEKCNIVIETMHGMNAAPEILCEKCNRPMQKQFSLSSAIIIGESFKAGRERQSADVGRKLEEFKEHPEKDPYKAHRDK